LRASGTKIAKPGSFGGLDGGADGGGGDGAQGLGGVLAVAAEFDSAQAVGVGLDDER